MYVRIWPCLSWLSYADGFGHHTLRRQDGPGDLYILWMFP